MPIPSHDTFLWYLAERLPDRKWKSKNFKKLGINNNTKISLIKDNVENIRLSFINKNSLDSWKRKYQYSTDRNILNKIQIEITSDCNMKCFNCDRSCRQAPSDEKITPSQISSFVKESIRLNHSWDRITIIGGEPSMHPNLFDIINELKIYKDVKKECKIVFSTNGSFKNILSKIPSWIEIYNSYKTTPVQRHCNYNESPIDNGLYFVPYCSIPWRCGMALTRYGYFPCGAGASLCRVFGFDIGIKSLKELNFENIKVQLSKICKFCGNSPNIFNKRAKKEMISKTWKRVYEEYKKSKPILKTIYE